MPSTQLSWAGGSSCAMTHYAEFRVRGPMVSRALCGELVGRVTELGVLPYLGCIIAPDQRAARNAIKASGGL